VRLSNKIVGLDLAFINKKVENHWSTKIQPSGKTS